MGRSASYSSSNSDDSNISNNSDTTTNNSNDSNNSNNSSNNNHYGHVEASGMSSKCKSTQRPMSRIFYVLSMYVLFTCFLSV